MTDPRFRQRRIAVARENGRRRLHLVLGLLGLVVVIVGSLYLLHSPILAARAISVHGAPGVPRSEVIAKSGLGSDTPLVDVDTVAVEARLESIPLVGTAEVVKHWPDGISIVLTQRFPLAQVPPRAAGGAWDVVDRSGRVLYRSHKQVSGLPVVLAGSLAGAPGSCLAAAAKPLLAVAAVLPGLLAPKVRGIGLDQSGQVVLQLSGKTVALLGNTSEVAEKLVSLATVIHDVRMRDIGQIDLTAPGSPVLTPIGAGPTLAVLAGG
jgi:cell division protein FtsQ